MARKDSMQIGVAGEHYVAFRLAQQGFIVAIPRGGSPTVDLLVSNVDGDRTIALQVKTTEWAERTRGRGSNKCIHHFEFPLGHKAATHSGERFLYVFVDLLGRDPKTVPVAYIVPSNDIIAYCGEWAKKAPLVRWHPRVETAEKYREAWNTIGDILR